MDGIVLSICITPARTRAGCACGIIIVVAIGLILTWRMRMLRLRLRLGIVASWEGRGLREKGVREKRSRTRACVRLGIPRRVRMGSHPDKSGIC